MHGLVLAADGEGLFADDGEGDPPIRWQLETLCRICDDVTVVVGRGFVDTEDEEDEPVSRPTNFDGNIRVRQEALLDPAPRVDKQKIRREFEPGLPADVTVVVVPHWKSIGSAGYARLGLEETEGHVLVVDGGTLCREEVLQRMMAEFENRIAADERSVVAVKADPSHDGPSVRWNLDREITGFGRIRGHPIAGLEIVHRGHVDAACDLLTQMRRRPFPAIFTALDSTYLPIPPGSSVRARTPGEFAIARRTMARWEADRRSQTQP